MNPRTLVLAVVVLLGACAASSDDGGRTSRAFPMRANTSTAISSRVARIEQILDRSDELELTSAQHDAIVELTTRARTAIDAQSVIVQQRTVELGGLLDASPVDRAAIDRTTRSLGAAEVEIEVLHLALLVDAREVLTDAQRAALGLAVASR